MAIYIPLHLFNNSTPKPNNIANTSGAKEEIVLMNVLIDQAITKMNSQLLRK